MLKIKPNQWYDLNIVGLVLSLFISIVILFFSLPVYLMLLFELILIVIIYLLFKTISTNKLHSILINADNQWFVEKNDTMNLVELKDYWLLKKNIFIWLKGEGMSFSFTVSRSIIGAEKFSQLRTKVL